MATTDSIASTNYNVFLVEDDKELARLIQDYLVKKGFNITIIGNGLDAATKIPLKQPDMVILDIMLPGMSGMDVCRQVRPQYDGPLLMLTALDEDMDQMLGLELGADDYIIKPVQPRLLYTRIRTLLRRINRSPLPTGIEQPGKPGRGIVQVDNLTINLSNRTVSLAGRFIELTTAEFELLLLLAQDMGQVVDRDTIVQQLRGFDYDGLDRSIDRRISRLRKKLQVDSQQLEIIKTIRGKGYQLCTSFKPSNQTNSAKLPDEAE